MNIRCQKSVLLLLVALLSMPHVLMAMSVSGSPVAINPLKKQEGWEQNDEKKRGAKKDDGEQKKPSDDPMSASRFDPEPTSVFLPPPREYIRPLARAIRIHREGDHVHAAELIGQFLADLDEEDFLIFNNKAKGTAVSVSSIANEMLASLPKSAMDAYRVRFGVPARQRLNLAIAESNYFEIAQVKQRFLHTDAGLEAAMLLGHHHFDAGRVLLAADSFQASLDLIKQQGKSDSKLSVLTAVSWVLARRPELAEAVMKDLANTNGGKFRLGDQDVAIDVEQPLAAIETFIGAGPLKSSSSVDQWLLVGGNARRNATTVAGFPVGDPLWQVDVDVSQAALQKINGSRERIVERIGNGDIRFSSWSLVPASVPLIVDGLVLFGNKNEIQAVDFNSGKRVWAVEVGDDFDESSKRQSVPQNRFLQPHQQRQDSIDNSPWSDFLQGHASCDGKLIFRIVKSSAAPSKDDRNNRNLRFIRGNLADVPGSRNKLQAIDVLKEGELAWEVGGEKATGDPRLAQVSFLGAPLPIDGVLYAIGQRLEEIILVALNSTDGKLLWIQSLASEENEVRSPYGYSYSSSNSNYSLRPSYADGVLVCPTGKNALVGIDTVGRRLLWGMQTTVGEAQKSRRASQLATLQNPQVFIENSRIVAFDVSNESRLLAMDLLDGSPLMKVGKAGVKCREVLHVASVDEDQVVLVEKKRVRAISSNSGRKLWETSIADFGPPTGVGYVAQTSQDGIVGRALYLPTEGNTIIKIDLKKNEVKKNEVVDGIRAARSFGNLIVHQGRLISRSETSIACFELDSKVVAELKNAIDKTGGINQLSPQLKIKQAALLRNQGKHRQAIELLKTIDDSDRSDRFKIEFLQNATSMFNSDPEFALKLVKQHESWFQFETNPELFLEYVELLVENNLVDDMLKQIFEGDSFFVPVGPTEEPPLLQRPITGYNLSQQKAQAGNGGGDGVGQQAGEGGEQKGEGGDQDNDFDLENGDNPFDDDGASSFLKDQKKFSRNRIAFAPNQWAKTQLIRTVRDHPGSKAKIQAAVEQRLKGTKISDVVKRYRFFRQFPFELISPKLRFELAKQLIAKKHVAESENVLASLVGFLPTTAKQIETVEIDLSKDDLVVLWQSIRDAQYGAKVDLATVDDDVEASRLHGCDEVEINAVSVPNHYESNYPAHIELRGELVGQLLKNKRVVTWGYGQEIEFLDANGVSENRFSLFDNSPNRYVNLLSGSGWIQANHSLAVLRHKSLLLTLDLSKLELGQLSVLWYKNVTPRKNAKDAGEMDLEVNQNSPTGDIVASFPKTGCCCFVDQDKLVCVDAFTGKTLWARTKDDKHTQFVGNGSQLVTTDSKQTVFSAFDIRTGERIRTGKISDFTEALWIVDGTSFVSFSIKPQSHLGKLDALVDYQPDVEEESKKEEESDNTTTTKTTATATTTTTIKTTATATTTTTTTTITTKPKSRVMSRYDVEANKFVWKKAFSSEAKICQMADDRILVLSADNQIYIFDAKSGKELAKMPSGLTEAERMMIRYVGSMNHGGQDLVALVTAKTGASISTHGYRLRSSRSLSSFFSGHLLLLSRGDMKPVWSRPAEVSGFNLLPMQPSNSPLLIFNRSIESSRGVVSDRPAIAGRSIQLLGLDLRTGKVALNKIFGPTSSVRFYPPLYDVVAGTIDMKFSGWEVRLKLKNSLDKPPSPVASVTNDNPVPRNYRTTKAVVGEAESKLDVEKIKQRLVQQAEEYEAALEQKRAKERALLESEAQ